jgi:hypothetical protein
MKQLASHLHYMQIMKIQQHEMLIRNQEKRPQGLLRAAWVDLADVL